MAAPILSDDQMAAPVLSDEQMLGGGAPPAPTMVRQPKSFTADDQALGLGDISDSPEREAAARDAMIARLPADVRSPEATHQLQRRKSDINNPLKDDWLGQTLVTAPVAAGAGSALSIVPKVGPLLAGAGEGALSSAMQGGGPIEGGAIGAGVRMLGPLGRAVMGSKGGKARQLIEKYGGDVGLFTPGSGQPFEDMVTTGTTDEAIGQQARASAEKGLDMLNQERKGVLRVAGKRIARASESDAGRAVRPIPGLVTNMDDAVNDLATSDRARGQLQKDLGIIRSKQKPGFNPDVDEYELSEADLNKVRRNLDRQARTGVSADEERNPLRQAAEKARSMVNEGPLAEPNAIYAKESKHYGKSRRLLGIKEKPTTPEETRAAVDKVTNLITRKGQNTVTAGKQIDDLTAFEARHPDIGAELAKPSLLRAKADLSVGFRPKQHGGLIDRLGSAGLTAGLADAALTQAGHGIGGQAAVVGALLGGLALRNAPAIEGRLLYGPASAAVRNEAELNRLIPLFTAARAAEEHK